MFSIFVNLERQESAFKCYVFKKIDYYHECFLGEGRVLNYSVKYGVQSQANVVPMVVDFCLDQTHKRQDQVDFQTSSASTINIINYCQEAKFRNLGDSKDMGHILEQKEQKLHGSKSNACAPSDSIQG